MTTRTRLGALAVILAVVVGALTLWRGRDERSIRVTSETPAPSARDRDYAANSGRDPAAPPRETPAEQDAEVAAALSAWRDGVIQKDSESVIRLDMTFQERPDRYLSALVASSQIESNERVRAFSTRTLGKFRRPTLALHFRRLLADQSPFVRQNAAWALGEVANVPGGREAARVAIAELLRTRAKDIDSAVRAAARAALDKIE
jgi:HEAT repeat protein